MLWRSPFWPDFDIISMPRIIFQSSKKKKVAAQKVVKVARNKSQQNTFAQYFMCWTHVIFALVILDANGNKEFGSTPSNNGKQKDVCKYGVYIFMKIASGADNNDVGLFRRPSKFIWPSKSTFLCNKIANWRIKSGADWPTGLLVDSPVRPCKISRFGTPYAKNSGCTGNSFCPTPPLYKRPNILENWPG